MYDITYNKVDGESESKDNKLGWSIRIFSNQRNRIVFGGPHGKIVTGSRERYF